MTPRDAHRGFTLWLVSALLLVALAICSAPRWRFATDIAALLPATERDAALEAASYTVSQRFAKQLVFLVGGPDLETARRAGAALAQSLELAPSIARVRFETAAVALAPDADFNAARFGLLTAADAIRLAAGEADALAEEALAALYSPAGMGRLTPVLADPFGFNDRFLREGFSGQGRAQPEAGVLVLRGDAGVQVLVLAETRESPFSVRAGVALASALDTARAAALDAGGTVMLSGVAPHALAAAAQAQHEISRLGGGAAVLCAALLWAVFGAFRPSLLALLSMGFGMSAGLVFTQLLFGELHLMTVVFGTSLVGVSMDYAIHFLSDQLRDPAGWRPTEAREHIGTAVRMGLATALVGYLAFAFAPLEVLRQMAVFSALGLMGAAWTVWLALPYLARRAPMRGAVHWHALARALRPRRLPGWFWLLLAGFTAAGLARLTVSDDLRALQQPRPKLLAEEKVVRDALGTLSDSRFFVVQLADVQARLKAEEALGQRLDVLVAQGALGGVRRISQMLPSQDMQAARRALLAPLYAPGGAIVRLLESMGFAAEQIAAERAAVAQAALLDERALAGPRYDALRLLWLDGASLVMLSDVRDAAAVAAAARGLEGVHFRDPLHEASTALEAQRVAAQERLLWVYAAMLALLVWRYGVAGGLATLAVPLVATVVTLAVLAFAGRPVTLFTIITLLLVLGFGVDYAIFLREGARDAGSAPPSSRLAVWLAAATALLSFGGLSFSSTPFLRDIGLTLTLGIALAFVFSLLLAPHEPATTPR